MSKLFMVEFDLPEMLTPEFVSLIPAQRNLVNQWLADGEIKGYSLSMDRSRLWVIFVGQSEFEIMEKISEMPLTDYLEPEIRELAFHNTEELVLQFSLN